LNTASNEFTQRTEEDGNLTLWRISGIVGDAHIADLKETLNQLLAAGRHNIIIDCEGVQAIDSRGLGLLITTQKEVRNHEGRMALVNLNAQFAALLELTRLNRVFEIFMDMETAKRSFGNVMDSGVGK